MALDLYLDILRRFSLPFGRSSALPQTFASCLDTLRELVSFDCAGVAVVEGDNSVRIYNCSGDGAGKSTIRPLDAMPTLARVLAGRKPVLSPLCLRPGEQDYPSGIVLPLLSGETPVGTLNLASHRAKAYDDHTASMLEPLARLLAAELDRVQLARAEAESSMLNRFGALLASAPDVRQVFPQAASLLKPYMTFDGMAILLLDENKEGFTIFAATESARIGELGVGVKLPLEGTASGLAVQSGEGVLVRDTAQGTYPYDRVLAEAGLRTHLVEPLKHTAGTVGTLSIFSRETDGLGEPRKHLLGAVANTLAIAVDNTRLFNRLSMSEDRYSSLVENAEEVIYGLDTEGRLSFVNRKGEQLWGSSREQLQGRAWEEIVYQEDGPAAIRPLLEGRQESAKLELRLKGADGRSIPTSHNLRVIRDGQKVLAIQGIARDVTREREAQRLIRRYHDLVEALDDYVFMAHSDGRLITMNRKARHDLGVNEDDYAGMTIFDLHPSSSREDVEGYRKILLETGSLKFEVPIVTRSGSEVPTRGNVTYQRETETLQGVFRDITEQTALNERLIQMEKLRALGEMASGVAHTFNNLMAVIGTTVQVIRRADREADLSAELNAIEQAVRDGGEAVRRIQDFTRRRQGDLQRPLDLNALATEVARLATNRHRAAAQAGAPAIDIKLDLGDVPPINGVDSQLREVLMNILFNAMDALRDGGTVSLRSYRHQGRVVLTVQDTGSGMSDDVRSKIFQPFFSTKEDRGSGLGLSIALNIISQHGGTIEVDTEQGTGTTVRLLLPELTEIIDQSGQAATPKSRKKAHILLVEDEQLLLNQLSRLMEDEGHSVDGVSTGEKALARLDEGAYDIVFTDVGMTPVTGWDVAAHARKCGARVVFITGWGGEVSEETAAEKGVNAVLRKPFPPDRVFRIIASLLEP